MVYGNITLGDVVPLCGNIKLKILKNINEIALFNGVNKNGSHSDYSG
jgi:hypothetical protein